MIPGVELSSASPWLFPWIPVFPGSALLCSTAPGLQAGITVPHHLPPGALSETHTSLLCPFSSGSQCQGQVCSHFSKPSRLLATQAALRQPHCPVTHQAGSKQTPQIPLPRAAAGAQPFSTPVFMLSGVLKPSMTLHVSRFIFIRSDQTSLSSA